MADYYAETRSNYFKVRDEVAFRAWATLREVEVWDEDRNGQKYFCIAMDDPDRKGWYTFIYDAETDEITKVRAEQELAAHLQDGSVAILMEIGSEGDRYLAGKSIAVNSRGETATVDLRDIMESAETLGEEVTEAEF